MNNQVEKLIKGIHKYLILTVKWGYILKIYRLVIFSSLLIILLGGVSAADHTPHDTIMNTNSSCTLLSESLSEDEFHVSVQEDNAKYNSTHSLFVDDIKNQSLDISNNSINTLTSGKTDFSQLNLNEKSSYDNQYYLFRGDCWTINNNFE